MSAKLLPSLYAQVYMVRLERVFLFMSQGWRSATIVFGHLDVFYLMEVYPLQNVRPLVGLLSPREKHVRAGDVSS